MEGSYVVKIHQVKRYYALVDEHTLKLLEGLTVSAYLNPPTNNSVF